MAPFGGDFTTIQSALDIAVAGDTITVRAGTYNEKIRFASSGNADSGYITLRAFEGETPILSGLNVSGIDMVLIEDRSYVKLIGFEIRDNLGVDDGSGVRITGSGSHIEIRDNKIHEIRGIDAMGITVYGTSTSAPISDLTIDGNEIFDSDPAESEALTLNGNIQSFTVTNNTVHDVNNIAIDFIGGEIDINPVFVPRDGLVSGNRVYRSRANYGGGFGAGIYVDGAMDIIIENNVVSESDLGIEIGAENPGVTSGITVRNNLIFNNDKAGLVFGGFDADRGRVRSSSFTNNVCYMNDRLGSGFGQLWIQFAEDNVIKNNIFVGIRGGTLLYSEDGNIDNTLDYNVWFVDVGAEGATFVWNETTYESYSAYRSATGQDANSLFADPLFVDTALDDFHLQGDSPAVGGGDPTYIPGSGVVDIDGEPRLAGLRVDIGADETSPGSTQAFTMTDRGGLSFTSQGSGGTTVTGYGRIQPDVDSTTPSGLAIFGFRENGVLVSEAGVPASPLVTSGRIDAEVENVVQTGLAIANPNDEPVTVNFFFTDENGVNFGQASFDLPANGQIARFLNEDPFNGGSTIAGTLTFTSTAPVSVIALRGFTNERSEFLMTTLPVADLGATSTGPVFFAYFADGGGWTTQLVLVNPLDVTIGGTVEFFEPDGDPGSLMVEGEIGGNFPYSIPARSSQRLRTSGTGSVVQAGAIRISPSQGDVAPSGLAVFSFKTDGITVSESGVPALPTGSAFRMYAEASGSFGDVGSIQTGVAIANPDSAPATVMFELTQLDGTSTGLTGMATVPGQGQVALFLNQVEGFESLALPFEGVLRISTGSSSGLSVVGLRGRYNERGDFLIATTPPVDESAASTTAEFLFPQLADSGGYTTQFILFSGLPGQVSSGIVRFFNANGQALDLALQ